MSTCSICVEDAHNPVCCVPCGHIYCRICIDKWQKRSKNNESECPECREKIQDVLSIYIRKDDSKDLYCKKILAEKTKLQHDLQNNLEEKKQLEHDLSSYKKRLAKQNRTGKQMENGNPELKTNDDLYCKKILAEKTKLQHDLQNNLEEKKQLEHDLSSYKKRLAKQNRTGKQMENGNPELKTNDGSCAIFAVIVLSYIALLFVMLNYGFGLLMNISVTTSLGNMTAYILNTLYFILEVVVNLILILIGLCILLRILRWMIGYITISLKNMAAYILSTLYFILKVVVILVLILIGLWVLWRHTSMDDWMCFRAFLIIFLGTIALIKLFKVIAR